MISAATVLLPYGVLMMAIGLLAALNTVATALATGVLLTLFSLLREARRSSPAIMPRAALVALAVLVGFSFVFRGLLMTVVALRLRGLKA